MLSISYVPAVLRMICVPCAVKSDSWFPDEAANLSAHCGHRFLALKSILIFNFPYLLETKPVVTSPKQPFMAPAALEAALLLSRLPTRQTEYFLLANS
ncbi:hypothetical protein XBP1_3000005 [Xenorhabdus bovienii str. puntauvense]|uniref:Uncharacterized protein n=1 Tax=Xenorhabdus bovienii str. puntauvense TaxID=1398201 RepID=A0A077NKB8_XENBV|nr:hypothetical protein XBFFR1_1840009 [Xenorhabdus bovienii str. feltiae France]CDG94025.1 hypothetical protein XBFFL1_310009 [Xenorhabdus bovienii str. feltiae Florida]CDG98345.1 hypothetical protein XBP1_3000005 [Xenorhabdus bovienii str. puntauvense]